MTEPVPAQQVRDALAQAHRREWGRVLAATVRLTGDLGLAEEATQDSFVSALVAWGRTGVPERPGAWLTVAARRHALDALRRATALQARLPLLPEPTPHLAAEEVDVVPDDRLRLVFTCCHPALSVEARTALTLRLVCGLPTAEIARALLVPEATMAARITRAKKKVSAAGIPYRVPQPEDLPERLDGVLTVVHLLYTAGHTATGESLVRADVVERAMDLARVLAALMPDEPEALGLLALLELTDARRATRVDARGDLVLLEHQDRGRWDRSLIDHGSHLVGRALLLTGPQRPPGRFLLQAALAAVHAEAPSFDATDWPALVALYDQLLLVWPNPVVAVNRAAALAFAVDPTAALDELDRLADDDRLAGYHYLPAARADLLRRLGREAEAAQAYREALSGAMPPAERRYLEARLSGL